MVTKGLMKDLCLLMVLIIQHQHFYGEDFKAHTAFSITIGQS